MQWLAEKPHKHGALIVHYLNPRVAVPLLPAFLIGLRAWSLCVGAEARDTDPGDLARHILADTGVRGGLVVHVGCGDGQLTAALYAGDSYLVHGLENDADQIARARAHVQSLGAYGPVSVDRFDGKHLPYVDNLVNLIVAEEHHPVPIDEMMRVLAPLGVAYQRTDGKWTKTVKPRPTDIDEWTHWLHGADGNAVAKDRVVGPPRHVQWIERPLWQRHHELTASPHALVSAGGRIFYICDEAPATVSGLPDRWMLVARDAFNGLLLWKRPLEDWGWRSWSTREAGGRFNLPVFIARRLVASGDRVYVTLRFNAPLTALDAATGDIVQTYDESRLTDEILLRDGILILSVNQAPQKPGLIGAQKPVKKRVVAIRADTGDILWTQGDYVGISSKADVLERITHLSLAASSRQVFFVEEDCVVSLDLKSGDELWRSPRPERKARRGHVPYKPPNLCTLVATEDIVLFGQPEEPYTRQTWNRGVKVRLVGLDAATGETLWTQYAGKWGPGVKADVFVIDGLVWTHAADEHAVVAFDLPTGELKRRFSTEKAFDETHHHRCFRNKATDRYLLTGRRGIEFIDLKTEESQTHHWVRGACRYGIMPCNGLVYAPPHPCKCYVDVKLRGFYALASKRNEGGDSQGESAEIPRVEQGPAYRQVLSRESEIIGKGDWPTYRHDAARSGATKSDLPAELTRLWQTPFDGRVSACTIAGGRVFAALVDQHRVFALDAKDGKLLWSCTAGGRVDTPPTVYQGLALFGCADGRVYCLRASDGELVWRVRVSPHERRLVAFGQLESPWPIHGTVLVKDDLAYVAAGRSTHLDGGIEVCAIRPQTGVTVRKVRTGSSGPHGLEDVLVSDGRDVHMRHLTFRLEEPPAGSKTNGNKLPPPAPRAFSTAGLLDDTYFSRVGWSVGDQRGTFDLLVFDEQGTYGFRSRRKGGFGGWFEPATGAYELAAIDRKLKQPRWSMTVPIRVRAMATAGETLLVAGPPDVVDPDDPWVAMDGRRGGLLWAVSATHGKRLAGYRLDSPPVFDGMAAAHGRLYFSTVDGKVVCYGGR